MFRRKIAELILNLLGYKWERGNLELLVTGTKSIKIHTCFTPKVVWLNIKEPEGIPTCVAEQDCFDIRIVPHGFVIVVTLKSEYREIEWIATN